MLISLLWKGLAHFLIALDYIGEIGISSLKCEFAAAQKSVQVFNTNGLLHLTILFGAVTQWMRNDKSCIGVEQKRNRLDIEIASRIFLLFCLKILC